MHGDNIYSHTNYKLMRKRYLPKEKKPADMVRGAYDTDGHWWHEEDIKSFTGGIVSICFGKTKEHIQIIEVERKSIKR